MLFNRISIVGVGLIGGSIGMAVRRRGLAREVVGVFRRRSSQDKALKAGAIDCGTMGIAKGASGADLIIVATPVGVVARIVQEACKFARKGAIIIDVGSTKQEVIGALERRIRGRADFHFVGCHPLAGSEKSGVEFAHPDLFVGALCILTKTDKTDVGALRKVEGFWRALGSRCVILSPSAHDRLIAPISHLPRLVAVALVNSAGASSLRFAAGGFKDTTRIAQGEPIMWRDVLLTNRKNIVAAIDRFVEGLEGLKEKIVKGDGRGIVRELERAQRVREEL